MNKISWCYKVTPEPVYVTNSENIGKDIRSLEHINELQKFELLG